MRPLRPLCLVALTSLGLGCGASGALRSSAGPTAVSYASVTGGSAAPYRVRAANSAPMPSMASAGADYARAPSPPSRAPRGESVVVPASAPPPPPVMVAGGGSTTITLSVGPAPGGFPGATEMPGQQQELPAGLLTAASVGDSDRRDNYLAYLSRHTDEAQELGLDLSRRLHVRVVDDRGQPVRDTAVTLELGATRLEGRTHGDGRWDAFPSLAGMQFSGNASLSVAGTRTAVRVQLPAQGDAQDVVVQLPMTVQSEAASHVLELGFAIDVTGSMGDELRYLNREVQNIVRRVQAQVPGVTVRVGAVFYRDRTDDVQVSQLAFTPQVEAFAQQMQNVYASGGGDYPEDMNLGLEVAMHRLQWTAQPATRVLVVLADAPPHQYPDEQFTYREAMREASARGIRLLPVAASGANRTVEYLFRAMGAVTSTPYVYLTDDSGVGGPHLEADTDRVAVERFNDMLVRMVTSELRSEGMHEPGVLGPQQG